MNHIRFSIFSWGLLVVLSCSSVTAQPEGSETTSEPRPESTINRSAVDLKVPPRIGVGHTTAGSGFDGFTQLEGFIPLSQIPGKDLTFLEARLLIDNGAHLGSNFLIGYRTYDSSLNRTFGGYVGFDSRVTENSPFFQLGMGVETQGDIWDFRVNGYLPVGETRRFISQNTFDTGLQISTRFQDHFLVLDTFRERQSIRQFEAAAAGFDLEAGAKLVKWDRGNLRTFGGLYFYDAPGSPSTLGWRLRLQAEPTENFDLGLAVQDDALFGTNVIFSFRARLPGVRPRDTLKKPERVIARLRESWIRTDSITIDQQQEVEFLNEQSSEFLTNPEEDQPYFFQHVVLGNAGGDGTFESPFGTVQTALDATRRDGNDIVYVDGTAQIPIPAFSIPDRVQVLSHGPRQILAGLPFSTFPRATVRLPFDSSANFENGIAVELPFSGDGNFPLITGGGPDLVTLGNRTVLAGFRSDAAVGNGILGTNVRQVELRNNIITNSEERGIFLNDVGGEVVLFDNIVTNSQGTTADSGQGIFIQNTTTLNASDVVIAGYEVNNNRVGIEVVAIGDAATTQVPSQIVDIGPSSSANTSIGISRGFSVNNTISNNTAQGVRIRAANLGSQEISVTNSTISNNGGPGIEVDGGVQGGSSTAFQEVFIRNNLIQSNSSAGIDIEANETVFQEAVIDSNVIRSNAGAGIITEARGTSFQEFITDSNNGSFGISNNLISNNGGRGIDLNSSDVATQAADINKNSITENNTTPAPGLDPVGITVTADDITNATCAVVSGNTVPEGIQLSTTSFGFPVEALFQVGDRDNILVNNESAPVQLLNSVTMMEEPTSFEDISQSTCFP